jgi:hypothetical protein
MHLVRNQDAVDRALAVHCNVRLRSQYASDSVLLSKKPMGFLSPCSITTFRSENSRDELTNFLAGQASGPRVGAGTGAFLASEVLSAQFPDKVTEFVLDNLPEETRRHHEEANGLGSKEVIVPRQAAEERCQ